MSEVDNLLSSFAESFKQGVLFGSGKPTPGSLEHFLRESSYSYAVKHCMQSGSRVICDPPVMDTDVDYLVLVDDLDVAGAFFHAYDWHNCLENWLDKEDKDKGAMDASGYAVELECGARFQAWRQGEVNVILTDDETLHMRSVAATLLAKQLNLQSKEERIKLFRCIKFGEAYGGRYT